MLSSESSGIIMRTCLSRAPADLLLMLPLDLPDYYYLPYQSNLAPIVHSSWSRGVLDLAPASPRNMPMYSIIPVWAGDRKVVSIFQTQRRTC